MFVKLLGLADVFSGLVILTYTLIPHSFVAFAALYLIFKGAFFAATGDFMSYFDAAIGLYIVLLSFGVSFSFLSSIFLVFLIFKGVLSII